MEKRKVNPSSFEEQTSQQPTAEVQIIAAKEAKAADHDAEMNRLHYQRVRDDNEARKNFSAHIFTLTVIWMFLIFMVVVQCARGVFHLSDTVLVTLITTTTANVFGFFYVVVNYLFNKDKST